MSTRTRRWTWWQSEAEKMSRETIETAILPIYSPPLEQDRNAILASGEGEELGQEEAPLRCSQTARFKTDRV